MNFSFAMSFEDFCKENDLPRHAKAPTPERPGGVPSRESLLAWRAVANEVHARLVKADLFDPLVPTPEGYFRVARRKPVQVSVAHNGREVEDQTPVGTE